MGALPVAIERPATPPSARQQVELLQAHLAILRQQNAPASLIGLVETVLETARQRLKRELEHA